jgi:hypothetical protein
MGGGVPGHTEVQLDIYTDEFQLPLLATTGEHYRRKAEVRCSPVSLPEAGVMSRLDGAPAPGYARASWRSGARLL